MSLLEKYFKTSDNQVHKATLEIDDTPFPPISDETVAHMICWHRDYQLGNQHDYKSPTEFFKTLLEENKLKAKVINFVKNANASNNLEINYNRSEKIYELIADYKVWWNGNTVHRGVIASDPEISELFDDIVDSLPYEDIINILEKNGYYFLPLSIYDHSGITMYIGNKLDHYDGQWDCSNVGWIYTTKNEINLLYNNRKESTWKREADKLLRDVVRVYDLYLRGECYGVRMYDLDTEEMRRHNYSLSEVTKNPALQNLFFIENDSIWGIYDDDANRALTETIRYEFYGEEIVDTLTELKVKEA